MKRSRINQVIKDMEALAKENGFHLPPFCSWTPEEWDEKGHECDYGLGRFDELGFALVTIRNGNLKDPKYKKPYAEKLLMLYPGQDSPLHYHWSKMEDIINRGGNDLYITVFNGADGNKKLDTDVTVVTDGVKRTVPAGTRIRLTPGESITITQYLYHDFVMPKEGGPVLLGEVSMCNDDENDNCFYEQMGRFPEIEEDEPPYRYLCTEYPAAKD